MHAIFSNDYSVPQFVERTGFSRYEPGTLPEDLPYFATANDAYFNAGGEIVLSYKNMDFFASTFGTATNPVSLDLGDTDSLKMNIYRTDPEAELQVKLLFAGGGETDCTCCTRTTITGSRLGSGTPWRCRWTRPR